jgi:hypothetical protein
MSSLLRIASEKESVHDAAMPTTEIVDCRVVGSSTWQGGPEQVYTFQALTGTNIGSHFTCRTSKIPWQVQCFAIDGANTKIKAKVSTERASLGDVELIDFVVD